MLNPDFWFDDEVANTSPHARLLYMGLWGICDDNYATLPNRPNWIKAQIFPYEDVNMISLLEELVNIKKLIPFEDNNQKYFFIKNFFKHQKVEKPSRPKYPCFKPDLQTLPDYSPTTPQLVDAKEVSKGSKKDFFNKKSPLKVKKKEMRTYNENNHSDSDIPSIDLETGDMPLKEKKEPKNKLALEIQKLFILMAKKTTGVAPIKDAKGYFVVLNALKYLTRKQVIDLFKYWFGSGRPDNELISITRALSHNNINKFKIENGITN